MLSADCSEGSGFPLKAWLPVVPPAAEAAGDGHALVGLEFWTLHFLCMPPQSIQKSC